MKTIALAISLVAAPLALIAGTPSISVVEESSRGELKPIASIRANDGATRAKILQLWKEARKAFPKERRDLLPPDSGFVSITITDGDEKIVVRSCHPLFEHNPNVVVTSRGVEVLGDRNREDVLKADEEWYRSALSVFDKIVRYTRTNAEQAGAQNP